MEEVCRSLDGLPLAIELAAARVRSLSIPDIARRLDDRFALVGAIAWSYDLLFPDGQRALWALSCFAGSASQSAIEHVLAALDVPAEAVLDTMARLVDRSLVNVDAPANGDVRRRRRRRFRAAHPLPARRDPRRRRDPDNRAGRGQGHRQCRSHRPRARRMARLAAVAGDDRTAQTLLAEADALVPEAAHVLDEADRTDASAVR